MISKKTINAVELCVLLAGQSAGCYLSTGDLSSRLGLSISHLENIFKPLKDNGIVSSMKGPGGGYRINGDVSLISIWQVASVFETTLFDTEDSMDDIPCGAYELELEMVVIKTLKGFTLADFANFQEPECESLADANGRFKFKPLPMPFVPKAPNSVFQLGMSF